MSLMSHCHLSKNTLCGKADMLKKMSDYNKTKQDKAKQLGLNTLWVAIGKQKHVFKSSLRDLQCTATELITTTDCP